MRKMTAGGKLGKMTTIALMTAVICVVSPWSIQLPVSPVPISMSMFAVLLSACLLGARDGSVCCLLYLLLGGIGLPIFSGGVGGPARLFGPTGGYLLGYPVAAAIAGAAAERWKKNSLLKLAGMLLGVCGCYVAGTLWLCVSMRLSLREGLLLGVMPYLLADFIKIAMAYALGRALQKRGL